VTYDKIVVVYKPNKSQPNRSRLTVGGNLIKCLYNVSIPTCDFLTINMLWNSVLSAKGATYITLDISNVCLGTLMNRPEYTRLPTKLIRQEIIARYNLNTLVDNGWVYVIFFVGCMDSRCSQTGTRPLEKRLSNAE
jgi:hypothetical protein